MKQRFLVWVLGGFLLCPSSCFMAILPRTAAPFLTELAVPGLSIERAQAIYDVAERMKEDRIDRTNAMQVMDAAKKKITAIQVQRERDRLVAETTKLAALAAQKVADDARLVAESEKALAEANRLRAEREKALAEAAAALAEQARKDAKIVADIADADAATARREASARAKELMKETKSKEAITANVRYAHELRVAKEKTLEEKLAAKKAAFKQARADVAAARHAQQKAERFAQEAIDRETAALTAAAQAKQAVGEERVAAMMAKAKSQERMKAKIKVYEQQLKSAQESSAEAAKMFAHQAAKMRAEIDGLRTELSAVNMQHARERAFAEAEKGVLQDAVAMYDKPREEDAEVVFERRALENQIARLKRENAQIAVLQKQLVEKDAMIARLESENMRLGFDLEFAQMTQEMQARDLAGAQERLARLERE